MSLRYKSHILVNKLSSLFLAVVILGCQTPTVVIEEEKEGHSLGHAIRSSDIMFEGAIRKTLKMEQAPLDVGISPNGRWIFVLTRQGNILVYSVEGELKDIIAVGSHVDGIKVGPWWEDLLVLLSQQNKAVQFLEIAPIQNINISDSPFKAPQDAPVVIVVFSDFQ